MALILKNSKKTHEFVGLCLGLLADNRLVVEEVEFLRKWLRENPRVAGAYPIKGLFIRLCEMLDDKHIDEAEEKELFQYLYEITGSSKNKSSVEDLPQLSSKLEFCNPVPKIDFEGKNFLLTGVFIIGTNEKLEDVILEKGGTVVDELCSNTDYCIVGAMAEITGEISEDLGRKINKFQEESLKVISEESWVNLIF